MAGASVLSLVMVRRVGDHFAELQSSYIPAYGDLARANIRSLERVLTLRRMIILHMQPLDEGAEYEALREALNAKGQAFEQEIQSARALIGGLIRKGDTFADEASLVRIDSRLEELVAGSRRYLDE